MVLESQYSSTLPIALLGKNVALKNFGFEYVVGR